MPSLGVLSVELEGAVPGFVSFLTSGSSFFTGAGVRLQINLRN
jgi:hypothetical protein